MVSSDLLSGIDEDVLVAARNAAAKSNLRFVIGWWNHGVECRFMLLPEGHHVTTEPPFLPLLVVTPSGHAEPLTA